MRKLSLANTQVTRSKLLALAESIPGAWVGIRIAGLLLILSGWSNTAVAELFGLSRWSVVKWIRKANEEGLSCVEDRPRPGRPSRVSVECRSALETALEKSPKEFGIARARWDGLVVVEYLKRFHGVMIRVRRAQVLLRELGYTLKQPAYRYVQASQKGLKGFRGTLKKTPIDSAGNSGSYPFVCG